MHFVKIYLYFQQKRIFLSLLLKALEAVGGQFSGVESMLFFYVFLCHLKYAMVVKIDRHKDDYYLEHIFEVGRTRSLSLNCVCVV